MSLTHEGLKSYTHGDNVMLRGSGSYEPLTWLRLTCLTWTRIVARFRLVQR